MRLADGTVTFEMKEHYAKAEAAKVAVGEFIRSWELDIALRFGPNEVVFEFQDAELIDRDPPPPGSAIVAVGVGISLGKCSVTATATVTRSRYPEPPNCFAVTPDVETLWERYKQHLEGREPLPSMAYFCYTVATGIAPEGNGSASERAAAVLHVDNAVLKKLSELSSRRGDATTARKMQSGVQPFTPSERRWLEFVIKALIRRFGELHCSARLAQITMVDLPPLA
jgi:hypothetical protein